MKYRKLAWPFTFYFLIFAGAAAYRPYLVLYYQSLSFSGAQIGLLVGIAPLITLASVPLITGLADRTKRHKWIMSISLIIVILGLFLFPYLKAFIPIFTLTILTTIFFSPVTPLSDSAIMFMLGGEKEHYGRIRLGGTIGFSIAATIAGSLVENSGLKIAFWSAAALYIIAFIISQELVYDTEPNEGSVEKVRKNELLRNPHFLLFLLISFTGGVAYATFNTYLFPYMKELGSRESMMGVALTIGTIAEIPLLLFVSPLIKKFKAYPLLIFSILIFGLRFLMLAIVTNPIIILFVQLLNGFTHPLLTVAGVTYADEHAPKGYRASAQGLFNAFLGGIGAAVGGFFGGVLFDGIGARGMYFVFFIFVSLVLILVSFVHRKLPSEQEIEQPAHLENNQNADLEF